MKTLALCLALGTVIYIHRSRYRRLARAVGAHYVEALVG